MTDEAISLHPYDPAWPARFESEAAVLAEVLGPYVTGGIHHVGSTAIPGLSAKPIVDIMIGVTDLDSSRACIEPLAGLDYCYAPYREDVMHWFCKPNPARRTHHLHLVPTGSARFVDVLAFRDYLRAYPEAAERYEALKQRLAAEHAHDRNAYTDGKTDLVATLTAEARRWVTAGT
ncbi:GrpB family protein [Actinoplanes solisilvae]|uniref:GrpB family protein n=1 Tax=Actinoplanes solisilvae TaxID=2486853 RepID=UPI00196AF518|nr:GrpB family protein [Actinoplanes solisilvae]